MLQKMQDLLAFALPFIEALLHYLKQFEPLTIFILETIYFMKPGNKTRVFVCLYCQCHMHIGYM